MPSWFVLLVALVAAYCVRAALPAGTPETPPLQFAWFAWVVIAAQAIWAGIQATGQVIVIALQFAVHALFLVVEYIHNALIEVGKAAMSGFRSAWTFLRTTYEDVLKPGWQKFWLWVDRARAWLNNFFAPVFRFLRDLRNEILGFYEHWVRPVLDAIEIARKGLQVLASLGIEWAKKLDGELARLEALIDAPFQFALRKINEVIGIVDRIVTADGLFQRLALIRSIERDLRYVSRAMVNWRSQPLTDADYVPMKSLPGVRTMADVTRDTEEILLFGTGRYEPIVKEMRAQWEIYLKEAAPD